MHKVGVEDRFIVPKPLFLNICLVAVVCFASCDDGAHVVFLWVEHFEVRVGSRLDVIPACKTYRQSTIIDACKDIRQGDSPFFASGKMVILWLHGAIVKRKAHFHIGTFERPVVHPSVISLVGVWCVGVVEAHLIGLAVCYRQAFQRVCPRIGRLTVSHLTKTWTTHTYFRGEATAFNFFAFEIENFELARPFLRF